MEKKNDITQVVPKKSKKPIYYPMIEDIKRGIECGALIEGTQIPSETTLANKYQISRTSVRQGLRELEKMGKIVKLAGKGSFIRSQNAPQIATGISTTNTISYIVPRINDPFVEKVHSGISEGLEKSGYNLVIQSSEDGVQKELDNIHQSISNNFGGIVLFPIWGLTDIDELAKLSQRIPMVFVDRVHPNISVDFVATDNFKGGQIAAEHLIENGHRKIGMIRGIPNSGNEDRYRGFCYGLERHNIRMDESNIVQQAYFDREHDPVEGGEREMEILLNQTAPPTAIFASNDSLALGAEKTALKLGLKIPDDVSIIGFDDSQYSQFAPVPITTLRQLGKDIGKTAIELLLENIKEYQLGLKKKINKIEFVPQLIKRHSVKTLPTT